MTRRKPSRPRTASHHVDDAGREDGFTLIELLVVVVILGVLIAIAIPLYLNYKKGATDKAASADLRGAINALEQCYSDAGSYPAAIAAGVTAGASGTACTGQTINVSSGTLLTYFTVSSSDTSAYIISAKNNNGSKTLCYNSRAGGSVATTTTAVTAYRYPC